MVRFWRMSTVATVAIVDAWHAWTVATPTPGHHRPSKYRSIVRRNGRTIVTAFRLAAAGCRSSHGCDGNGHNRIGCSMCRVYQTASRRNRSATVDDGDQVPSQPIGHDLVVGTLSDVVSDDDRKPDVVCIGADCPQPLQANLVGPGIVVSRGIDRIG